MKFSLSDDEIKANLENIVKQLEKELILRLSAGGIDFEDFDPDTFEYNPDSAVHSGILILVQKLENTKTKLDKYK
jgi:hypothetical protein